jgi:hypothetical protein
MARKERSVSVFAILAVGIALLVLLGFGGYSLLGRGWYEGWIAKQLVGQSEDFAYVKLGNPDQRFSSNEFDEARKAFEVPDDWQGKGSIIVFEEGSQAVLILVGADRRVLAVFESRRLAPAAPGSPNPRS